MGPWHSRCTFRCRAARTATNAFRGPPLQSLEAYVTLARTSSFNYTHLTTLTRYVDCHSTPSSSSTIVSKSIGCYSVKPQDRPNTRTENPLVSGVTRATRSTTPTQNPRPHPDPASASYPYRLCQRTESRPDQLGIFSLPPSLILCSHLSLSPASLHKKAIRQDTTKQSKKSLQKPSIKPLGKGQQGGTQVVPLSIPIVAETNETTNKPTTYFHFPYNKRVETATATKTAAG